MADKSFGVKELNLLNASGTPTVTSPNNLNLNANTVAISTSATVGSNLTVSGQINVGSNIKLGNAGVVTATTFVGNLTGTASANAVLTGSTNDQLVTVTGANAITGESGLTYNGSSSLVISGSGQQQLNIGSTDAGGAIIVLDGDSNGDGAGGDYSFIRHSTDGNLDFFARNPSGATNYIFRTGTSEKVRIQSGGGISFNGDTAADNALNDYEEGNYGVSITGSGGGSIGMQAGINNLRYTKIGRLVHVTGRIYLNSSNNPSGTAKMSLPFTSSANDSNSQNGQGYSYVTRYNVYNPNSDWNLIFEIEPNQSYGFFLWDKPGAAWDGVNAGSQLNQNACYLGFDFTYTTAA